MSEVVDMTGSVMGYVEHKYTVTQYTIFHTYFTQMGDKTTFRSLSKDLNVSTSTINSVIHLILKDIRSNDYLKKQYNEFKQY